VYELHIQLTQNQSNGAEFTIMQLAYHQKTSPVFNVRRTLPLGSSSGAPGGYLQTLLAYLNSYTGSPLSGASSSRSPALPTKPYLLPSLPTSIHPWNITPHLVPCVRLTPNCFSFPVSTRFGSRSFAVAAPTIWNSLPQAIRSSVST